MKESKLATISNLFEGQEIWSVWDPEREEYYFSVVDVVKALTNSPDARKYWSVLKNRLTILEGTLENDSNLSPAIKNVLNNPRLKGIHNVIGRLISTEDTYRLAIEMALSSAANFLVVDSSKDAQKAIAFLKENKLGRVTFFPLDVILGRSIPASVLEEAKRCPGFINTANNLVTFDTKYQSIIENQLGQVLVVKDFKALEDLGEKTMHRYRIVSLEGEISHVGGSITGGYNKKTTSYLEVKADISECQMKLATIKQNLTILEKKRFNYYG